MKQITSWKFSGLWHYVRMFRNFTVLISDFSLELICSVRLVHSTPLTDHYTETHRSHRHKDVIWLFQILMTMFYPKLKRKKKR